MLITVCIWPNYIKMKEKDKFMNIAQKLKLAHILQDNQLPLLIEGMADFEFDNSVSIMANITERELYYPSGWDKELSHCAKTGKAYLVIKGLDKISVKAQEKFITLIKDLRAGNYKIPENVQIIILVNDKSLISQKILNLIISWTANNG